LEVDPMTEKEAKQLSAMMQTKKDLLWLADAKAKELGWVDLPHFFEMCCLKLLAEDVAEAWARSDKRFAAMLAYAKKLHIESN
jgi:hypothetical protein